MNRLTKDIAFYVKETEEFRSKIDSLRAKDPEDKHALTKLVPSLSLPIDVPIRFTTMHLDPSTTSIQLINVITFWMNWPGDADRDAG